MALRTQLHLNKRLSGPLLGADLSLKGSKGRIVMISSVAGKNGNPLSAPYCTSKHAIEGCRRACAAN